MASTIAFLLNDKKDRVDVAVIGGTTYELTVPRGLAFAPKLLPAPAPEPSTPGLEALAKRLLVDPSQHQDLPGGVLLDYRRSQAILIPPHCGDLVFGEINWLGYGHP